MFRSIAAFWATLTITGGFFLTLAPSLMCFRGIKHRKNISSCLCKQKVWAANCFLGDSRKIVKSEIMANLNHCSVKKKYCVPYTSRRKTTSIIEVSFGERQVRGHCLHTALQLGLDVHHSVTKQ